MADAKVTSPADDAVDPLLYLLEAAVTTQENELNIQGAVANVTQAWAQGAFHSVQAGDNLLQSDAAAMSACSGDSSALALAQAQYQTDQTMVSNVNQQYSNVVQGGNTAMTSLTQIQSQNLQFCQIVNGNMDAVNSLISQWGS